MTPDVGFLYFTDPENCQAGIAAVRGRESRKINNVGELDTSTKWMTNLETALPGENNARHALFLKNDYLRMSSDKILSSLNATSKYSEENQAVIMAGIFSNVVSLGEKLFEVSRLLPYGYRKSIRKLLLKSDTSLPIHVSEMALDSTQFYTFSTENTNPEKRVTFTIPKVSHGQNVLRTPLPSGDWQPVDLLPNHSEEIPGWVSKHTRPFFAKVTLSDFDPKVQPIINFGSNAPDGSERQWVTNIELEMLIGKADITVREVWESNKILPLLPAIETVQGLIATHDLGFSLGLLVENLWSGLALNSTLPPHKSYRENDALKPVNVAGPFLRAADRKYCFEKALALQQRGFTVASYGVGKIVVDSSFHEDHDILSAALDLDLLPPYLPELEISVSAGDPYLHFLQAYYATGDTEGLLHCDQIVADEYLKGKDASN